MTDFYRNHAKKQGYLTSFSVPSSVIVNMPPFFVTYHSFPLF